MNNIVKIILGLNIAAGGAGIFFGMTKSGKIGDLITSEKKAVEDLGTAKADSRDFKKKFENSASQAAAILAELNGLKGGAASAKAKLDAANMQISQANEAKDTAETAAKSANMILKEAEKLAQKVPGLEGKLADYENINYKGTKLSPTEIQIKLAQLENLTKGPVVAEPPKTKKIQDGELIGAIQSHDAALDFYVINAGRDNGIKIGDQFLITGINSSKPLGYIQISRVQPSVSIAIYKKGFPRPAAPFQNGYKVWKSSL